MKKNRNFIITVTVVYLLLLVTLVVNYFIYQKFNFLAASIVLFSLVVTIATYYYFSIYHRQITGDIETNLSSSMTEALKLSRIGILVYNEDYEITWLSSLFTEKDINHVGDKILVWLPELRDLLSGKIAKTIVVINDDKYEVSKKDDAYVLFFNDISREYDLENDVNNSAYVLGIVNFDNYDELTLNENDISFINTNIKVAVVEYFRKYGIVYKTLRNNRLLLILNNSIYKRLLDDRFSVLNTVRRESKNGGVDVTLSMSFAYGSYDLIELDKEATSLMEIAQTRGGDQVVSREIGKEANFYGGSSEAKERASRVKVRVVANTVRNLINGASNVIIVGHKDADADCIGAALTMSYIVSTLGKKAYVVTRTGGVETMIKDVMDKYSSLLSSRHNFISESEGLSLMDEETLVIMVDHHSLSLCNSPNILKESKKNVIIDHHRRSADLDVDALFIYIEAGASSTVEMSVEMLPYFSRNLDISKEEANILYIGLLIDTNHFRNRSDSRTFDVAKTIKQLGANSNECEILIEEPYDMSKKRYEIIAHGKKYHDNIMIAYMDDGTIYPRSIASQAVDRMVEIKEINAAFVLCKINKDEVAISARSDGNINVQLILEKMGGGGHLTAAGMQVRDGSLSDMYANLVKCIDEYLESVEEDESNSIE